MCVGWGVLGVCVGVCVCVSVQCKTSSPVLPILFCILRLISLIKASTTSVTKDDLNKVQSFDGRIMRFRRLEIQYLTGW